mmetsp:Transcript_19559/g.40830  ORF Transcript_19559/g.40830 Transcript_19559/m.40830 type:complete len:104 (-) Transcript_19559:76-387(-)
MIEEAQSPSADGNKEKITMPQVAAARPKEWQTRAKLLHGCQNHAGMIKGVQSLSVDGNKEAIATNTGSSGEAGGAADKGEFRMGTKITTSNHRHPPCCFRGAK